MKIKIKSFKIIIEYDGSLYHGWQRQKNDRTIQGEIEKALNLMTDQQVVLVGSGRTDAGVHAIGQVASFKVKTRLNSQAFHNGLNSLLSCDIVIKSCEEVTNVFHARFDAKRKTYKYYIMNKQISSAIGYKFFWHISKSLDLEALKLAASYFIGNQDFKSFEGAGSPRKHTIRMITKSFFQFNRNGLLIYNVEANGFLRFMVRNIVGTLIDIGLGRIKAKEVPKLIQLKDRSMIGPTAPPHGLFLFRVDY